MNALQKIASTDADTIVRLFAPRTALHVGCGRGYLVQALRERGVKAYGIDSDERSIASAPDELADHLYYYDVTSGQDIVFPKVDVVISFDYLNKLRQPHDIGEVRKFLEEHGEQMYVRVKSFKPLYYWQDLIPEAVWEIQR